MTQSCSVSPFSASNCTDVGLHPQWPGRCCLAFACQACSKKSGAAECWRFHSFVVERFGNHRITCQMNLNPCDRGRFWQLGLAALDKTQTTQWRSYSKHGSDRSDRLLIYCGHLLAATFQHIVHKCHEMLFCVKRIWLGEKWETSNFRSRFGWNSRIFKNTLGNAHLPRDQIASTFINDSTSGQPWRVRMPQRLRS